MTSSDAWDVVVLGSGIAGLAGALAAHELGLRPIVLEKASTLGGGTVNSYGLIWVGQNHLAQAAGYSDTRDETIAYMRFLGGGSLDDDRMSTFVDRSPEALIFFEKCGIRFHVVRGVTDHYYGKSPGSHAIGRSVEVDLISGFDLGDWRDRVSTPDDVPCFVTAEEQITWGGINSFSRWDQDLVRERKRQDMRGKGLGLISHFLKVLRARSVPVLTDQHVESLAIENHRVTGVVMRSGESVMPGLSKCAAPTRQRGMEANAQGFSVAEWSQSSGILHEDLGTVEAPLDSIDSECEKAKQNFLENPSISKKERVERYVRLHTLGIDDHVDLVPASSWTADKARPKLIVKIEPPRCK
jgi:hypothetical protein